MRGSGRRQAPPGPDGRPLVGNLADFEADRLGFLVRSRDAHGPVVRFDRRTTILNDPGLARAVLLDREQSFTVPENFLARPLSPTDLARGWDLRRVVNPLWRPQAVCGLSALVAGGVERSFGNHADGEEAVDPLPRLERVTSSALASYYFGSDGAPVPAAAGELLDALTHIIGNPFALPPTRLSPARRRVARRHAALVALVRPLVQQRRSRPAAYADFVSKVVADAPGVPTDRLTHWVLASLLAGHRVPAAAGAWSLMTVAERPRLQLGLQAEATQLADDLAFDRPRTSGEYALATAVVLETLRLYPPTWLIVRTSSRRVALGGYRFEPRHNFLVSPYVLQRDPMEWPSADEFLPERWLERPRPQGIFTPFGLGRHSCPGRDPALHMLVVTLLSVVRKWTLARSDSPVRKDPRTALLPSGLRITFRRRLSGDAAAHPLAG